VSACKWGKTSYPSSNTAHRALRMLRRRTGDRRAGVYCCRQCAGWHIGTDRSGARDGMAKRFFVAETKRRREREVVAAKGATNGA
jgi:hypothetical protein